MDVGRYILLMGLGYLMTITVETAILLAGLSSRHPLRDRFLAGVWLTACTYPVVWLVIPYFFSPATERTVYLWVAEVFAPAAECGLFWLAFGGREPRTRRAYFRDMSAIIVANLASFGIGEILTTWDLWPL
jgi:hypothetical protein